MPWSKTQSTATFYHNNDFCGKKLSFRTMWGMFQRPDLQSYGKIPFIFKKKSKKRKYFCLFLFFVK